MFLPVEQALIQPECGWLLLKQSRHYYTQTRHASHYYRSQAGKTLDPYPISRSLHGPFLYFESQWGENLPVGTILTSPYSLMKTRGVFSTSLVSSGPDGPPRAMAIADSVLGGLLDTPKLNSFKGQSNQREKGTWQDTVCLGGCFLSRGLSQHLHCAAKGRRQHRPGSYDVQMHL